MSPAPRSSPPLVGIEVVRGGTPDTVTAEAIKVAVTRLLAARETATAPAQAPAWSRAARIEAATGRRFRTLSALGSVRHGSSA